MNIFQGEKKVMKKRVKIEFFLGWKKNESEKKGEIWIFFEDEEKNEGVSERAVGATEEWGNKARSCGGGWGGQTPHHGCPGNKHLDSHKNIFQSTGIRM